MTNPGLSVDIVGFVPIDGVEIDEYRDYLFKRFRVCDLKIELENGNMPPGLAIRDHYGVVALVAKNRRELRRFELK